MRPDQLVGASSVLLSPCEREKPVVLRAAVPAPERIPGHTEYPQLFVMVNVADNTTVKRIKVREISYHIETGE